MGSLEFKLMNSNTVETDKKYWKVNYPNYIKAIKSDFANGAENQRRIFKKEVKGMKWYGGGYYNRYSATKKRRQKLADLTQSLPEGRSSLKVIATVQALWEADKIESKPLYDSLMQQYDYMVTDGARMIWWQDTWLDPDAPDVNLDTPIVDNPEEFPENYPNDIEGVLPDNFSTVDHRDSLDNEFYQDHLGSRWLTIHKHGLFSIIPKLKSKRTDYSIFIKGGHADFQDMKKELPPGLYYSEEMDLKAGVPIIGLEEGGNIDEDVPDSASLPAQMLYEYLIATPSVDNTINLVIQSRMSQTGVITEEYEPLQFYNGLSPDCSMILYPSGTDYDKDNWSNLLPDLKNESERITWMNRVGKRMAQRRAEGKDYVFTEELVGMDWEADAIAGKEITEESKESEPKETSEGPIGRMESDVGSPEEEVEGGWDQFSNEQISKMSDYEIKQHMNYYSKRGTNSSWDGDKEEVQFCEDQIDRLDKKLEKRNEPKMEELEAKSNFEDIPLIDISNKNIEEIKLYLNENYDNKYVTVVYVGDQFELVDIDNFMDFQSEEKEKLNTLIDTNLLDKFKSNKIDKEILIKQSKIANYLIDYINIDGNELIVNYPGTHAVKVGEISEEPEPIQKALKANNEILVVFDGKKYFRNIFDDGYIVEPQEILAFVNTNPDLKISKELKSEKESPPEEPKPEANKRSNSLTEAGESTPEEHAEMSYELPEEIVNDKSAKIYDYARTIGLDKEKMGAGQWERIPRGLRPQVGGGSHKLTAITDYFNRNLNWDLSEEDVLDALEDPNLVTEREGKKRDIEKEYEERLKKHHREEEVKLADRKYGDEPPVFPEEYNYTPEEMREIAKAKADPVTRSVEKLDEEGLLIEEFNDLTKDELLAVEGIGPKIAESIQSESPVKKIDVIRALTELWGIGKAKASSIVDVVEKRA